MTETSTEIFNARTYRKTEFDIARGIIVSRHTNGNVDVRVTAETERDDEVSLQKTLTPAEAEDLGRVLLCMDATFASITDRAGVSI